MRRGRLASGWLMLATVVGVGVTAPVQAGDATGTWSNGAPLITSRSEHTATLLPDGAVLVAGGSDGKGKALANAELYGAASRRWVSVGSMATARLDHTATLLPSGKVLVTGGQVGPDPFSSLATAELYDPATGSWATAAPMLVSRARHSATLLADGRVLVVGGLTLVVGTGGLFPSSATDAEVYDPRTDRWSTTGPMGCSRLDATVTRLADGRVLVAGGQCNGATLNSTEIYDTGTDRWISAAPMAIRRSGHAAALLPDGDVLVAGGTGEAPNALATPLSSAEIYNPVTNLWVSIASMVAVQAGLSATVLANGTVLIVGFSGRSRPELYDPARNAWRSVGPPMDRVRETATRLRDGTVLLVGGVAPNPLDSVALYDPNGVGPAAPQPLDRRLIAAVGLAALLLVLGVGLAVPSVRRRLRGWAPRDPQDEWIA